jgi:hypothetical protein
VKGYQLRDFIRDVLEEYFTPKASGEDAVELLMLTAAQESLCGEYIRQEGGGPALGIYQMEPITYLSLWNDFIAYREDLKDILSYGFPGIDHNNYRLHMMGNLVYQTVIARIKYLWAPEALPDPSNPRSIGKYYKKYWNTYKGKATVEEAVRNYLTLCK